jgi:DNA-binding MarR family transcriptional regulator
LVLIGRHSLANPWPREVLEFISALEHAAHWLRLARRGLSGSYGLTISEWRVLHAVRRTAVPPSIAQLAGRMRITRQSVHRTVAELRRAGWLRLERRTTDRRILGASLTPPAVRTLDELESMTRALLLEVTNDLTPRPLGIMTDALTRVAKRLRSCSGIMRSSRPVPRRGERSRRRRQPLLREPPPAFPTRMPGRPRQSSARIRMRRRDSMPGWSPWMPM